MGAWWKGCLSCLPLRLGCCCVLAAIRLHWVAANDHAGPIGPAAPWGRWKGHEGNLEMFNYLFITEGDRKPTSEPDQQGANPSRKIISHRIYRATIDRAGPFE